MSVSIVTTVAEPIQWLADAYRSVLAQTFGPCEHVIYADGVVLPDWIHPCENVVLCGSHIPVGRARALRAACAKASGEFIGLLDADDILDGDCVERCVDAMRKNRFAPFCWTDCMDMSEGGDIVGVSDRCRAPYSNHVHPWREFTTFHFRLMRAESYHKAGGFDTSYPVAMDFELCLRLEEIGTPVHVEEPLYFYRKHADQISAKRSVEQSDMMRRALSEARVRRQRRKMSHANL